MIYISELIVLIIFIIIFTVVIILISDPTKSYKERLKTFNKKISEHFSIQRRTKYKFNKYLFRVWLAIVLIMLGVLLINYGDFQEYNVSCSDTKCTFNVSMFEDKHIIEQDLYEDHYLNADNLFTPNQDFLYSGEKITFSNYEKKPFLIKHFFELIIYSLMLAFLINHIWFRKEVKE